MKFGFALAACVILAAGCVTPDQTAVLYDAAGEPCSAEEAATAIEAGPASYGFKRSEPWIHMGGCRTKGDWRLVETAANQLLRDDLRRQDQSQSTQSSY
jgi:hypothetical protein